MINSLFISLALLFIFVGPIIYGLLNPINRYKIEFFAHSLLDTIELIASIVLTVILTKKIFSVQFGESNQTLYMYMYDLLPEQLKLIVTGNEILIYIISTPLVFAISIGLLRLITTPIYIFIFRPLTALLSSIVEGSGPIVRAFIGGLWRLPKSLLYVLILGVGLNFYAYFSKDMVFSKNLNDSKVFNLLYNNAIYPVMTSNLAKKIPVIVNDSFKKVINFDNSIINNDGSNKPISKKNINVIQYFNGVTLDEAIKSTPEINQTALKITADSNTSRKKSLQIYKWICGNVKYDFDKAKRLGENPTGISSGAIVAYNTKTGVCFDYSALYVAMCRAVGLKVRLVTGLGYSGISWGDHAWNQVYCEEEARWINVDATFGTDANYFDRGSFNIDHKYSEIQGEW